MRSEYRVRITRQESPIDGTWDLKAPKGAFYVQAAITDCTGSWSAPLSLDLTLDQRHLGLSFLVLLSGGTSPEPAYFEVNADLDPSDVLSVVEQDRSLVIRNVSEQTIHRCDYDQAEIVDVEYLVDGAWGEFGRHSPFEWDVAQSLISPGESIRLQRGLAVIRKSGDTRSRPEAKRYVIRVQPDTQHFRVAGSAPSGVAIVPACDRYIVRAPTTDEDPWISIDDQKDEAPEQ